MSWSGQRVLCCNEFKLYIVNWSSSYQHCDLWNFALLPTWTVAKQCIADTQAKAVPSKLE